MKKLKNKAGFSLIEMLAAVAVLVILITGMEAGLNAGTKAYSESLFESNSGALSGILNTALGDILRYSEDIAVNPGLSGEVGAPEGFEDAHGSFIPPEKAGFAFTNYEYGVRAAYFEPRVTRDEEPRIILALKNLDDTKEKELVNTGAYPYLEIDNFTANYDEEKGFFYITYDICDTEVEGRKRAVEYTVRLMNPEVDSGPASETVTPIPRPPHPGGDSHEDSGSSDNPGTNPAPHTCHFVKTDEVVKPSCLEAGYTVYRCSCGKTENRDFKNALGHDWTEWEVTKAPTLTEKGEKTKTCKRCDKTETKEIPKLKPSDMGPAAWQSDKKYQEDDIVKYDGKIYYAKDKDNNLNKKPSSEDDYWEKYDEWEEDKEYKRGNVVQKDGQLYVALAKIEKNQPITNSNWKKVSPWKSETTYHEGNFVVLGEHGYRANRETNKKPGTYQSGWSIIRNWE